MAPHDAHPEAEGRQPSQDGSTASAPAETPLPTREMAGTDPTPAGDGLAARASRAVAVQNVTRLSPEDPENGPRLVLLQQRAEHRWVLDHPLYNFDAAAQEELDRIKDPHQRSLLSTVVRDLRRNVKDIGEEAASDFVARISRASDPEVARAMYFRRDASAAGPNRQIELNDRYLGKIREAVEIALELAERVARRKVAHRVIKGAAGYTTDDCATRGYARQPSRIENGMIPHRYAYAEGPVNSAQEAALATLMDRLGEGSAYRLTQSRLRKAIIRDPASPSPGPSPSPSPKTGRTPRPRQPPGVVAWKAAPPPMSPVVSRVMPRRIR
jgi:hypothetical protein